LNNILTDDEEEEVKEEVRIKPSRMSTEKEKEIIENILKSVSPKIVVQKIPTSMLNSNGISASKITAFNENQKRLTKDLMCKLTCFKSSTTSVILLSFFSQLQRLFNKTTEFYNQ
jgi:hypothetical protein